MLKRIFAILLSMVLLLSAAGCGTAEPEATDSAAPVLQVGYAREDISSCILRE